MEPSCADGRFQYLISSCFFFAGLLERSTTGTRFENLGQFYEGCIKAGDKRLSLTPSKYTEGFVLCHPSSFFKVLDLCEGRGVPSILLEDCCIVVRMY